MTNEASRVNASEARSTIEMVESARSAAAKTLRPPKWLNVLSSLLFGVLTIATSLRSDGSVSTLFLMLSATAFVLTAVYWLRLCRNRGATTKMLPLGFTNLLFHAAQAAFFAIMIFGSKELYESGVTWAPYAAAFINAAALSYMLHNYPTNDWRVKAASQ